MTEEKMEAGKSLQTQIIMTKVLLLSMTDASGRDFQKDMGFRTLPLNYVTDFKKGAEKHLRQRVAELEAEFEKL